MNNDLTDMFTLGSEQFDNWKFKVGYVLLVIVVLGVTGYFLN